MSGEADEQNYWRGLHLLNLGRYEDAAAFFREAISGNIENAGAYANLARCLVGMDGKDKEALDVIDQAIKLEPEESYYFSLRSSILVDLNRRAEALSAAKEAVTLDPDDPMAHASEARAHMARERWKEAEMAARRALAIDGDHSYAQNILAAVLRLQGRLDENEIAVEKLLADDPEDEMAHVNAGYSALHRGDHKKAEVHFREALRIDPGFESAREGLIASFRARSWFFRKYLSYCFFMTRFTEGNRWVIIIGLYLAVRFGRAALAQVHPLLAVILGVAYLIFVLWVWLANGIGSFIILSDPMARYALRRRDKLEAYFVGGGFFGGILLLFLGGVFSAVPLLIAGATLLLGAIPASLTFTNESSKGRLLFGGVFSAVYLFGISAAFCRWLAPGSEIAETTMGLVWIAAIAVFVCTWLGNVRSLRE